MEKIVISGFDIGKAEKVIINNIIQGYESKIAREIKYNQLSLRLKGARRGRAFLHEIEAKLEIDKKKFNAKVTDYNLFYAVSGALEKILNELKHYIKK